MGLRHTFYFPADVGTTIYSRQVQPTTSDRGPGAVPQPTSGFDRFADVGGNMGIHRAFLQTESRRRLLFLWADVILSTSPTTSAPIYSRQVQPTTSDSGPGTVTQPTLTHIIHMTIFPPMRIPWENVVYCMLK